MHKSQWKEFYKVKFEHMETHMMLLNNLNMCHLYAWESHPQATYAPNPCLIINTYRNIFNAKINIASEEIVAYLFVTLTLIFSL